MHNVCLDLNWNTVRYLQSCENLYPPHVDQQAAARSWTGINNTIHHILNNGTSVTHLNFQLMPYPWFRKQQVREKEIDVFMSPNENFCPQAPLYKDVTFPPMFKGVVNRIFIFLLLHLISLLCLCRLAHLDIPKRIRCSCTDLLMLTSMVPVKQYSWTCR